MARLDLVNVSRRYGGTLVLDDVSLRVEEGEFLVIVGPSGCGKSTLLRIVAGLVPATSGDVLLDGVRVNDLEPRERDVAMVFQNYALYPHMTVSANLAFPLKMRGAARADVERAVGETAELLELGSLLARKPAELSGGQMQRVALGRALIRQPRLFLFDEPLSNPDAQLRVELRAELLRLHASLGITTLYVTHDQAEAMTLGARICVLHHGRVEQVGPPLEVFDEPRTRFVAGFLGSPPMNLIEGRVAGGFFERGSLRIACDIAPERADLILGVRPHEIRTPGPFEVRVTRVESLGAQTCLECDAGGARLCIALEGRHPAREGDILTIGFDPSIREGRDGRGGRRWFDPRTGARMTRT